MTLADRFRAWVLRGSAPAALAADPEAPAGLKISLATLAQARASGRPPVNPWTIPQPFKGPAATPTVAMDSYGSGLETMYAAQAYEGAVSEGLGFLGYPYLAELSQRPEYRRIADIYALECTRKWIKITGENEERVDKLEKALKKFKIQSVIREVVEHDSFFGRSQIFIDLGDIPMSPELRTALMFRPEKIKKDAVKNFKVIEPIWSYPGMYNADSPISADFYRPKYWQVQSAQIHATRIMTFVGREMPDVLKPAYAFGGLSLTQMAKPYVDNWLRTRQSVSDLLHSFSTMVLATDMGSTLSNGSGDDLFNRADLFTQVRDNRGLMLVNKDTEDLSNVSTPLGTLDKLQAQSQEQIASVTGIPLVILLGVTPSGLNASSDGEIKAFYATINGYQERVIREPLETILKIIQLNEFGDIDDTIAFDFEKLWEMDEQAAAAIRKSDADADVGYINAGVVSPDEARERIANDEESPYFGMDLSAPAPEAPGMEDDEADAAALAGAQDDFREDDHPRAANGQFGSGGGAAGSGTPSPAEEDKPTPAAKTAPAQKEGAYIPV